MKNVRQMPQFAGEIDGVLGGSGKASGQAMSLIKSARGRNFAGNGECMANQAGKAGGAPAEYSNEERALLCHRVELLEREVEYYRSMVIERCMEDDLCAIREIDPKVEGLDSLGTEYADLIRAGVAAPIAYHAIHAARKGKNPPSMGDVKAAADSDEVPISYAQAMSMSPSQVEGSYDKLRRSMRNWK